MADETNISTEVVKVLAQEQAPWWAKSRDALVALIAIALLLLTVWVVQSDRAMARADREQSFVERTHFAEAVSSVKEALEQNTLAIAGHTEVSRVEAEQISKLADHLRAMHLTVESCGSCHGRQAHPTPSRADRARLEQKLKLREQENR